MDRLHFYSIMNGEGTLDYELYLNTKSLLSCQKDFAAFCNKDELQEISNDWLATKGRELIAFTIQPDQRKIRGQKTRRRRSNRLIARQRVGW